MFVWSVTSVYQLFYLHKEKNRLTGCVLTLVYYWISLVGRCYLLLVTGLFLSLHPHCGIDLFADTATILIFIVSEDIMGCSGGKLICICPLGIP